MCKKIYSLLNIAPSVFGFESIHIKAFLKKKKVACKVDEWRLSLGFCHKRSKLWLKTAI